MKQGYTVIGFDNKLEESKPPGQLLLGLEDFIAACEYLPNSLSFLGELSEDFTNC